MIVQTAEEGAPRFVIPMAEHTSLSAQMARAFGNDGFEPVAADEEVHFAIANHDAGWADLDARFLIDSATGYPYNLAETPFDLLMTTSRKSPDFNEAHHPFSGLLSSMHSWGLYNGRYGLSDIVLLDKVASEHVDAARGMLGHEEDRQERLKGLLRDNPETESWVVEERLMTTYKHLQFFDTLALYFNRVHEGARAPATFPNVPRSETEDADVTVTPLDGGRYRVDPYPFSEDPLELSFGGRYVARRDDDADSAEAMASVPLVRQSVTLQSLSTRR